MQGMLQEYSIVFHSADDLFGRFQNFRWFDRGENQIGF